MRLYLCVFIYTVFLRSFCLSYVMYSILAEFNKSSFQKIKIIMLVFMSVVVIVWGSVGMFVVYRPL